MRKISEILDLVMGAALNSNGPEIDGLTPEEGDSWNNLVNSIKEFESPNGTKRLITLLGELNKDKTAYLQQLFTLASIAQQTIYFGVKSPTDEDKCFVGIKFNNETYVDYWKAYKEEDIIPEFQHRLSLLGLTMLPPENLSLQELGEKKQDKYKLATTQDSSSG